MAGLRDEFDERRARVAFAYVDQVRSQPAITAADPHAVAGSRRAAEFFERGEVNTRAVWALRRELSPQERAQIRALEEYERLVSQLRGNFWDE